MLSQVKQSTGTVGTIPIHLAFDKVGEKWQERCAYIQSDNITFIFESTDYVSRDLFMLLQKFDEVCKQNRNSS